MGIIQEEVKKAFDDFKEATENQQEQEACMLGLILTLMNVAYRMHNNMNRATLQAEIKEQFRQL